MITRARSDGPDLVLLLVGGVVVRREGLELGRAGVDRLEGRPHAVRQPGRPDVRRRSRRAGRPAARRRTRAAWPAGSRPARATARPRGAAARPRCAPAGARTRGRCRSGPPPRRRRRRGAATASSSKIRSGVATADAVDAAPRRSSSSSAASAGSALSPARPCSSERSAFCSDSQNVRPMAMTSPTDCMRVPRRPSAPGQLLEGPARDLGDDVVDGRLERRRRRLGDVVGDLVEQVADGEAGRDLGDGEARRLRGQRGGARHPGVHLDDDPPARRRAPRRTARWSRPSRRRPGAGRRRRRRAWPGTRRRSASAPAPP